TTGAAHRTLHRVSQAIIPAASRARSRRGPDGEGGESAEPVRGPPRWARAADGLGECREADRGLDGARARRPRRHGAKGPEPGIGGRSRPASPAEVLGEGAGVRVYRPGRTAPLKDALRQPLSFSMRTVLPLLGAWIILPLPTYMPTCPLPRKKSRSPGFRLRKATFFFTRAYWAYVTRGSRTPAFFQL